jgi:hypothetical protein
MVVNPDNIRQYFEKKTVGRRPPAKPRSRWKGYIKTGIKKIFYWEPVAKYLVLFSITENLRFP